MPSHATTSGWDVYVFGIPLLVLLFFGFFRLDELFTSRKNPPEPSRRPKAVIDPEGKSMLTDPDGRPWEKRVRRTR